MKLVWNFKSYFQYKSVNFDLFRSVRDLFVKLTGQNLLVSCWTQKTLDTTWKDLSLYQFSSKSAKYDKSYFENRFF